MMEYSIEIMRLIITRKENKSKSYKYPLIIPIIIYTGDKEWDAKLSMKELKEKVEWYEEQEEINLVDINKYTKEELLEEKNILSKAMLLEKSKNKMEFIENIEKVLETCNNENLEKIENIIRYKSIGMIGQNEIENVLEKIKKGEVENMTLAERINRNERKERMRIRKEGKLEGRREEKNVTIKKMLLLKVDENIIKEVTGVQDKELEKAKKELYKA